jgi:molybdopterin-guanine dinucleotide biosynthesis protein A
VTRGSGPPAVSAIVLAGGRSSRFGSDKLVATIDGSTVLDRAVAATARVAGDVVVVVEPGTERLVARIDRPLRFVADPERHGGPLIGLLSGLEVVDEPLVIVVGGDMPTLQADVLELLLRTLAAADPSIGAVVLRSAGTAVPLPAAVRAGAATSAARELIRDGERRLRSLFGVLSTRTVDEREWRLLDPAGATLRDVDVPGDL